MNKKKTHPTNIISTGKHAEVAHSLAKWHFAGEIPSAGSSSRPENDALQETIRWALDNKSYNSAINKLLEANLVTKEDLKHPTTIAYKCNIRDKKKFVPSIMTEDEWNAFRKSKPSDDRVALGISLLVHDLYGVAFNKDFN